MPSPFGSFTSILPCPLARPLSTTPDITTFDRDPAACRLPAPDLQTMGTAAAAPTSWLRSIWRHVTEGAVTKDSVYDCNEPARNLLPGCLVWFFVRSQFGEGPRRNGGKRTANRVMASDAKIKAARCGRSVLVACVCLHTGFLQPATALREVQNCRVNWKSKRNQGCSWHCAHLALWCGR